MATDGPLTGMESEDEKEEEETRKRKKEGRKQVEEQKQKQDEVRRGEEKRAVREGLTSGRSRQRDLSSI